MKRLKLLLVNLGVRTATHPVVSPPMGVMSLAAYVRERLAVDVAIVNQRLENTSVADLARIAADFEADVVGVSSNTMSAHFLPDLARACRLALPDAKVILGGPHASAVRERAMGEADVDAVVCGEGEWLLEQILRAVAAGAGFETIPGLIWRDGHGETRVNPGAPPAIEDLDSLPIPAYDLIDLPAYWRHKSSVQVPRRKFATLSSSRGCPCQCTWCHGIFGKRFRANSPGRMLEETQFLRRKYAIDDIEFIDDNFMLDRKRVIEFAQMAARQSPGLQLNFPNGLRGDIISDDMLDALVEAGLAYCAVSLESGSPRIQQLAGKRLDIPRFLAVCRRAAQKGVYVHGFCMMGFPTETEQELQMTIDVACSSDWHSASFNTVTPFPGTDLYKSLMQTHPEKLERICYDDGEYSTIRVNLTDLPDRTLFACQRRANRAFYLNPKRLYRLLRVHPQPLRLPVYVPILFYRATKGLFRR